MGKIKILFVKRKKKTKTSVTYLKPISRDEISFDREDVLYKLNYNIFDVDRNVFRRRRIKKTLKTLNKVIKPQHNKLKELKKSSKQKKLTKEQYLELEKLNQQRKAAILVEKNKLTSLLENRQEREKIIDKLITDEMVQKIVPDKNYNSIRLWEEEKVELKDRDVSEFKGDTKKRVFPKDKNPILKKRKPNLGKIFKKDGRQYLELQGDAMYNYGESGSFSNKKVATIAYELSEKVGNYKGDGNKEIREFMIGVMIVDDGTFYIATSGSNRQRLEEAMSDGKLSAIDLSKNKVSFVHGHKIGLGEMIKTGPLTYIGNEEITSFFKDDKVGCCAAPKLWLHAINHGRMPLAFSEYHTKKEFVGQIESCKRCKDIMPKLVAATQKLHRELVEDEFFVLDTEHWLIELQESWQKTFGHKNVNVIEEAENYAKSVQNLYMTLIDLLEFCSREQQYLQNIDKCIVAAKKMSSLLKEGNPTEVLIAMKQWKIKIETKNIFIDEKVLQKDQANIPEEEKRSQDDVFYDLKDYILNIKDDLERDMEALQKFQLKQ